MSLDMTPSSVDASAFVSDASLPSLHQINSSDHLCYLNNASLSSLMISENSIESVMSLDDGNITRQSFVRWTRIASVLKSRPHEACGHNGVR